MRRITAALLTIGLINIANAHTLDSEHSLAQTLWHQVLGGHHLPYTIGLVVGTVFAIVISRRISNHRQP
jgi:hypothetical protein